MNEELRKAVDTISSMQLGGYAKNYPLRLPAEQAKILEDVSASTGLNYRSVLILGLEWLAYSLKEPDVSQEVKTNA